MTICIECGKKHGKPSNSVVSCWHGKCDWCGKFKSVCADRNYGYPKQPTEIVKGKEK